MKLKEIKPGMVIHCKNDEEKKALYQELCRIGNIRTDLYEDSFPNFKNNRFSYLIKDLKNQTWGIADCATVEFSDLILPELTAEEAIKINTQLCSGSCDECPLYKVDGYIDCDDLCLKNPEKAVDILAQWKSDHEKKEPEIEWVYRVFGAENYGEKFFQTEVEAINRCEELAKSQKTKQYARYERVCRVKEVE